MSDLNIFDKLKVQVVCTEGASNNEEKTDIAYKPCTMKETKIDVAEWNEEYFRRINTKTPKKELDNSEHVSESFSSNYVWNKEGMVIKTESSVMDYEKARSIDNNEQDAENKYENREETKNDIVVVWDSDSYLKSIKVELLDQEDDNSGLEPPSSTDDMRYMNSQTMGNEDIDKHVEMKQNILNTLKVPTQTQYEKSLINDISNDEKINTGTLIEEPFVCDVCNKQFDSEIWFRKHALMHTGTGKSSDCDYKNLKINNKQLYTREKSLSCDVCHKKFDQSANLNSHKRVHTKEKPFACDLCDKRFIYKSALITHKLGHTGEEPFTCDVCDKRFIHNSNLISHKRVHTGEEPFACDICGKKFNQWSNLIRHKRVHTGEEPFACDICGKRFNQRSNFIRHKQVHTQEEPFACDACDKRFKQKSHLISHKRVHTGEEPFACDVCDKRFKHRAHLNSHKQIHTRENQFACVIKMHN